MVLLSERSLLVSDKLPLSLFTHRYCCVGISLDTSSSIIHVEVAGPGLR